MSDLPLANTLSSPRRHRRRGAAGVRAGAAHPRPRGQRVARHPGAAGHRHRSCSPPGKRSCASRTSRPTSCPARSLIAQTLWTDWGTLSQSLLDHAAHHLRGADRRGGGRRRARDHLHAVEVAGEIAVPLCGDPAGDAGRLDRAADHHLGRRHQPVAADLRLDRGVLPDPVEHHPRAQFRRPQSGQPVPALPREPLADACAICACRRRCRISSAA